MTDTKKIYSILEIDAITRNKDAWVASVYESNNKIFDLEQDIKISQSSAYPIFTERQIKNRRVKLENCKEQRTHALNKLAECNSKLSEIHKPIQ